jgi:hypothetical protein
MTFSWNGLVMVDTVNFMCSESLHLLLIVWHNAWCREVSRKCPLLCTGLLNHAAAATNMHTAVEEALGLVLSHRYRATLYKDSQRDPDPGGGGSVAWLPESWDRKIWSWVSQDPELRMTVPAMASRNFPCQMSTRNLPGGKGWTVCKADSLIAICELIVKKIWEPCQLITLWASMACYRNNFTFFTCLWKD